MTSPTPTMRSSVLWNAISLGGGQVIRASTAIALTALLGQENIGIISLSTIYVAFVIIFVQFGFGTVLIQKPDLTPGHTGAATWLSIGAGTAMAALTVVVAPAIASFYDTPELTAVLRALSLLLILKALAIVPTSLLMREMRFAPLARAELTGAVLGCSTGIVTAIVTDSYWAIVAQMLVIEGVTLIGVTFAERTRVVHTTRGEVREVAGFGVKLLGTNLVNFASDNGDNVLVGRYEGTIALADYSLSYRVLSLPLQVVGSAVARTTLPIFSRMQHDPPAVADLFYRAQRAVTALVAGPLVVVALASADAIPWAFGDEWSSAVAATQWVAIAGILRLAFGNGGRTMVAMGQPAWQFRWSLVTTVVSVTGFIVGLQWGIEGVAASIVVTGVPMGLLTMVILGRLIPVSPMGSIRKLSPVIASCLVTLVAWIGIASITGDLPTVIRLVVRCAVAGSVYVMLMALSPTIRDEVLRLFGRGRSLDPADNHAADTPTTEAVLDDGKDDT